MLNHPALKRRVAQRVRINNKYDVPGLAGCSKRKHIVYIDRDINPQYYKPVRDFALTRQALIDLFRISPASAAEIAAVATINHLGTLHLNPKQAKVPHIPFPPPDLDLSAYRPERAKVIKRRIKRKKALDKARRLDYNKQDGDKNVDRNLYQEWLSSLPKRQTDIRK